jgi:phage gp45-like
VSLRDERFYTAPLSRAAVKGRTMLRRLAVKVTTKALWQLLGHDDETEDAVEVFSGIGFYSRPSDDGSPEVVLAKIGGSSDHPVIVATRDERTRQALEEARDLAKDESIVFNSLAFVRVKADGTIEAASAGGTAVALATKADVDALQVAIDTHTHTVPIIGAAGTTPTTTPLVGMPAAAGTAKFKGE